MPSPRWQRLPRRGLAAIAALLVVVGAAAALLALHMPGNVSHPNVEFSTTTTDATPAPAGDSAGSSFAWPLYGYDAARTRIAPDPRLGPPFRRGWTYNDHALLEFPPVIYANALYYVDDNGWVHALDKRTGRLRWQRRAGSLAAASPAVGVRQGLLFVPVLARRGHRPGHGALVALSLTDGHVVWALPVRSGTESSPLIRGATVYFGDQAGNLYSVRAASGHVNWIGFGSGQFYATPAAAFGRVYVGNTDGRVYSFAQRDGELAWATATGGYVYASAAVQNTPALGPTVYVGSYDGYFYAFDARTGASRWRYRAGGKISGSATVVGGVVYFSDLTRRDTTGLDVRTGRRLFSFHDGGFSPVVADHRAIYLTGYHTLYELLPATRVRQP